ncbi:MAG TPA: acyl-CoA synthetase [Cyclobacteriaceae bacterium]|nr:acyl-CoA synthetase [Cyclobacteriaceae bacterium]
MPGIIDKAKAHGGRTGIISDNRSYSYDELLQRSHEIASVLLNSKDDLKEARVAFMISPGFEYVATQWAIWRAGGMAVPLCITYPPPSLLYVIENTGAEIVVMTKEYEQVVLPLIESKAIRLVLLEDLKSIELSKLPEFSSDRKAMILYTSGTTSLPKGVVTTHKNIEAQVVSLIDAWKWTSNDHIVCVLPLHHVHGVINVVSCALWSGAIVEFIHPFSPETVFDVFAKGKVNVFMAVPTIYFKLISYWESLGETKRTEITNILSKFRLMVSGSAALPVSIMEKWKTISSHTLLERYGMTEIGMAISNPYNGDRRAGYIGQPLPGVAVRLVDGEIQIKGHTVFNEYWRNPEATKKAFSEDGWFKTGDVAVIEDRYYRILGRDSVDIIKSGGYKISALEIEEVLRTHELIADCSVVGLPDEEWGELVAAALMVKDKSIDLKALSNWLRQKMPAYKTPRRFVIVDELPKNAMGKVVKNDVKKFF